MYFFQGLVSVWQMDLLQAVALFWKTDLLQALISAWKMNLVEDEYMYLCRNPNPKSYRNIAWHMAMEEKDQISVCKTDLVSRVDI
jgi:hypothetical protein